MKKTIIFLFINVQFILAQEINVIGMVFDEDKKPLPNILVSILSDTEGTLKYQYTNNKGEFEFYLTNVKDSLNIKASSLFYNEKIVRLKKNEKIVFVLVPKVEELDEIVITSSKKNRDTLNFNINKYSIKKNESVEKTLKKIPGISVDKDGRIKYLNKEIEKILIDGDDLANNQYSFISKNLRSEVIDDIQLLKNYEENTVLKKSQKSGKIALNLKVKDAFKNIWFGNISLGYGNGSNTKPKLNESVNLGLLKKKIKFLDFLKYSNLGNKALPVVFGESNDEQNNIPLYNVKAFSSILPNEATNFNKAISNTFLIHKKFKPFSFRSTVFIGVDNQEQETINEVNYFLQQNTSFVEKNNFKNKNSLFFGEGEIKLNTLRNSYLVNKFKYKIGFNNFNTLTNFNTTNTLINDNYKNRETAFYNYLQYTYDFGNRIILNNELKFGASKLNEESIINSDILAEFLNSNTPINQSIEKKLTYYNLKTDMSVFLTKNLKSNIAFGYKNNNEAYTTSLTPTNTEYKNNNVFNRSEVNTIASLIYNISRKTRLTSRFTTTFLKVNNLKKDLINYSIQFDTKLLGDIIFLYANKQEYPSNKNLLQNYYLINNTSFKKGLPFLNSLNYNLFKFQINHKNRLSTFNNEFSFSYKNTGSFLLQEYEFIDNINFNSTSFLNKKGETITFKEQFIFLINAIDIGFNIKTLQTLSKQPLSNENEKLNTLYNGLYNFEITSYFTSKFNFNLLFEYNKQTQKYNNTSLSFNSKNIILNLDYNINKEASVKLNSGFYEVDKNYSNIINLVANYSPKESKFSYELRINNLFNEREFSYQQNNSFFFSKETIPLTPLYSLASIKYIF